MKIKEFDSILFFMEKFLFFTSSSTFSLAGEAPTANITIFLPVSLGRFSLIMLMPFIPIACRLPPKIIMSYLESFSALIWFTLYKSDFSSSAIHVAYFSVKPDMDLYMIIACKASTYPSLITMCI